MVSSGASAQTKIVGISETKRPAGEIIARRTVPSRVGTWLGMVLVVSHFLIEKEAFHAIVGAVTASATMGSSPTPTAPTTLR
jgi:hypothetical protein